MQLQKHTKCAGMAKKGWWRGQFKKHYMKKATNKFGLETEQDSRETEQLPPSMYKNIYHSSPILLLCDKKCWTVEQL